MPTRYVRTPLVSQAQVSHEDHPAALAIACPVLGRLAFLTRPPPVSIISESSSATLGSAHAATALSPEPLAVSAPATMRLSSMRCCEALGLRATGKKAAGRHLSAMNFPPRPSKKKSARWP